MKASSKAPNWTQMILDKGQFLSFRYEVCWTPVLMQDLDTYVNIDMLW